MPDEWIEKRHADIARDIARILAKAWCETRDEKTIIEAAVTAIDYFASLTPARYEKYKKALLVWPDIRRRYEGKDIGE